MIKKETFQKSLFSFDQEDNFPSDKTNKPKPNEEIKDTPAQTQTNKPKPNEEIKDTPPGDETNIEEDSPPKPVAYLESFKKLVTAASDMYNKNNQNNK
ncbi:hypothetical protein GPJ56_005052 [Histomonas meleagridis]|uniref:uncharacterized protein n=1 Tax=Histomonas meleagridis TaxID=135588 RepID=UPI00355ABB7D|nr:hypothetical protein GPJ56_005052 [Histomonas meleagridis]KAH0802569.1 hypothetical protein GO595_004618 [Histomonas meleagridis]